MSNTTNKVQPFGMRDKLGYMFGDFGNDFTFILSSTFLMKFYTDVMGVSPVIVGMMMMVARFVDAFTDVTMGQIADRSRPTAKGKFLPWIKRMCGPVALASFLMYAVWFKDMPMAFKIVWMFATYLLWGSICYTGINIPYGSMASAISPEAKDRSELSSWRTIGATLASMFIGVVLPMIVYYEDAEGHTLISGTNMAIAGAVCSVCAVICYLICYNLTTEKRRKVQPYPSAENIDFQPCSDRYCTGSFASPSVTAYIRQYGTVHLPELLWKQRGCINFWLLCKHPGYCTGLYCTDSGS